MTVEVADTLEQLTAQRAAWEELADGTAERNVFYEPCLLIPAFQHLRKRGTKIIFVRLGATLIGVFPIQARRRWHSLPLACHALWHHPHCYLTTPLLRCGHEREALRQFLEWLGHQPSGLRLFELEFVSAGKFLDLLSEAFEDRGGAFRISTDYERAVFPVSGDFESFWAAYNGRHRTKQKTNRLSRRGAIRMETLEHEHELEPWIQDFLCLEAQGWKGKRGTALACSTSDTAYFRDIVRGTFLSGKLLFQRLRVGSKIAAMKCCFTSGLIAYSFKIAFDETFAASSPGLLLEIEAIRWLCNGQTTIRLMDSCASPGASLFVGIYNGSRRIVSGTALGASLLARGIAWRDSAAAFAHRLQKGALHRGPA